MLEDPNKNPPEYLFQRTVAPEKATAKPTLVKIGFKNGDPVSVNRKKYSPSKLLEKLNSLAGKNGVGRADLVENRFIGIKSRGIYETPGGTLLLKAHRAIESITLDGQAAHLKDELMPQYADLIYKGLWWSPERKALQALIDNTQEAVSGSIKLNLLKGNIEIVSRESENSLYDENIVTFEDDKNSYDQSDATGFIKINALRLKLNSRRNKK